MSTKTPKPEERSNPKAKPEKADQNAASEQNKAKESAGKAPDPESTGMEFPDGTGRKHGGDLGTGH